MSGKRKRGDASAKGPENLASQNGISKPMSAIAAARLKARTPTHTTEGVQEPPPSPLADTSASEAPESETEDISLIPQNFKLGTWRKTDNNVLSDTSDELTIVLDKHATATFVGCFDLKILKGAVNINGANLGVLPKGSKEGSKVHRVYVPSTHPITKIRGLDRTNHVQLRSCDEPTHFADLSPLFAEIWAGSTEGNRGRSFTGVTESDDDPLKRPLVAEHAPEDWLRTIDEVSTTATTTLIVGKPASGKSTFAKRLLNRYLTGFGKTAKPFPAVCYLDLNPSSPEYSTHGQISLTIVRELNLGPAFTHPAAIQGHSDANVTVAAHAVPHNDLTNFEAHFSSCAEHLFQVYHNLRSRNTTLPLIINTPGELYASHFPLVQKLLTTAKPNHVVHFGDTSSIDEDTAAKLHALQLVTQKSHSKLHELTAQHPVLPLSRTPAELRAMQSTSYFHVTGLSASSHQTHTYTYTPLPLTTLTPWEFSYKATPTRTQDLIGILSLHNDPITPSHLLTTLNGSTVHIVSTTSPPPPTSLLYTPKSQIPYLPHDTATHLPLPLPPSSTKLICTTLIRGIDPTRHIIHVIIPAPYEDAVANLDPQHTIFVAGCTDTPEWAYTEDSYAQVARRRRDLGDRARFIGDEALGEGVEVGPWVTGGKVVEGMGYLGAVRRVRRFLG